MPVRSRCGIWVDAERVTRPVAESKAATAARVSIGTAACRPEVNVNSTTWSAAAKAVATPAVSKRASIKVFHAAVSCTSGASGASASSRVTTGVSASISTVTCSARSSASAAVSAITAAIGSPT